MYEGRKVYGPYIRRDGRQIVILKTPGSHKDHKTISYPKYLVEMHLGRYLESDETVDHIDGNFNNNSLDNLRVVKRSEHCKSHADILKVETRICPICGKEFTLKGAWRKTCGSRSCGGKSAHLNGYNKGNSLEGVRPVYESRRHILDSILSVSEQNFSDSESL